MLGLHLRNVYSRSCHCIIMAIRRRLHYPIYCNQAIKIRNHESANFASAASSEICWNCKGILSDRLFFCSYCNVIQPLQKNSTYFDILKLKRSYMLSNEELASNFRKLQSIFHPDKFTLKLEDEQTIASEYSSLLNKAFSTLKHPVEKGEYLLLLEGQPIEEGELTMEADFLMDILDINEKLVDAEEKDVVLDIGKRNEKIMNQLMMDADEAFSSQDIPRAKYIVAKMKYYYNIYEKVKEHELKHGIVH